jgi:hypothetical protein
MTESPRRNILLMKRSLLMGFAFALPCVRACVCACVCACGVCVCVLAQEQCTGFAHTRGERYSRVCALLARRRVGGWEGGCVPARERAESLAVCYLAGARGLSPHLLDVFQHHIAMSVKRLRAGAHSRGRACGRRACSASARPRSGRSTGGPGCGAACPCRGRPPSRGRADARTCAYACIHRSLAGGGQRTAGRRRYLDAR